MIDHTDYARRAATLNAALCSHRFKMREARPQFEWCADCGKQLLRSALPRRTGKTQRRQAKVRK